MNPVILKPPAPEKPGLSIDQRLAGVASAVERLEDSLPKENIEKRGPTLKPKARRSKSRRDKARARRARR